MEAPGTWHEHDSIFKSIFDFRIWISSSYVPKQSYVLSRTKEK